MDYHRGANLKVRYRHFNHSPLTPGQLAQLYWKRKHPVPFSFLLKQKIGAVKLLTEAS
jgi:hypothetical protein